jgi:hypothetical protein
MISVAIIAKNAERHIGDCLRSVAWADDIVVFDAGSEDRTLEIARAFTDRIFVTDWSGYGPQKNRAIEATRGDWVLSLDTDECVPPPLHREIVAALSDRSFVGFEIPRLNHIDGRPLRLPAGTRSLLIETCSRAADRRRSDKAVRQSASPQSDRGGRRFCHQNRALWRARSARAVSGGQAITSWRGSHAWGLDIHAVLFLGGRLSRRTCGVPLRCLHSLCDVTEIPQALRLDAFECGRIRTLGE